MGCSRESASLWYWLGFPTSRYLAPANRYDIVKGRLPKSKLVVQWKHWRLPEFIRGRKWESHYFWRDTFLHYWDRWFVCPFRGHGKVDVVEDVRGKYRGFCFRCYQFVTKGDENG